MKPNGTESRRAQRRRDAIKGAVTSIVMQGIAGVFLVWYHRRVTSQVVGTLMLVIGLVDLVAIIPVVMVLRQRLNEIEGGEEDAARKY